FLQQRKAIVELIGLHADRPGAKDVLDQVVDEDGLLWRGADDFQSAAEQLRIRFRAVEAVRKDEAIVILEEVGIFPGYDFGVHFVRVRKKGHSISLPYAIQHLFDAGHGPFKEIGPRLPQVGGRTLIPGTTAEKLVEVGEGDRSSLQIAIATRAFEQLDQLVAFDRGQLADVLHHALVGELDHRVAEVEDDPGLFGHRG